MKFYELITRMSTSNDNPYTNLLFKMAIRSGDVDEICVCIYYSVIGGGK